MVAEIRPHVSNRFAFGKLNERRNTVPLRHFKQPTLVYVSHSAQHKHQIHYTPLIIPEEAKSLEIHVNECSKLLQDTITKDMLLELVMHGRVKHSQHLDDLEKLHAHIFESKTEFQLETDL